MKTNKTALITGASRGLGLELAKALAARGWHLIIDARGSEALKEAHRQLEKITSVASVAGDITDGRHIEQLQQEVSKAGGIDLLVNNASTLGLSPQPALKDFPVHVLEHIFRTNVVAPLALTQAVFSYLKPGASIINITSDAAAEAYPGWGGYGSSKAALEHLSAILAAENPELRIYWVDPGDMQTQMHQEAFPGEDISDRPLPVESVPGILALIEKEQPSGRYKAR